MFDKLMETFFRDEGSKNLLFGCPFTPITVIGCYLLFVLKIGPEFMKNRKPFELKRMIMLYNLFQIYICCDMVFRALRHYINYGVYHSVCMSMKEPFTTRLREGASVYLMAKYSELIETAFFILRKKYSQVTFLHVYHHSSQVLIVYLAGKFAANDIFMSAGALNSFVHIVMYSYYTLASLGPGVQKYLWWKKYITKLQMAQFYIIMLDISIREYQNLCPRVLWIYGIMMWQVVINFYLFARFYRSAYNTKQSQVTASKNNGLETNKVKIS